VLGLLHEGYAHDTSLGTVEPPTHPAGPMLRPPAIPRLGSATSFGTATGGALPQAAHCLRPRWPHAAAAQLLLQKRLTGPQIGYSNRRCTR
jgi:hypothetical protein